MSAENGCPAAVFQGGEEHLGFRITRVSEVPELRATAYEAVHLATNAQVLHLHCPDKENLYAITFRTPPPDSSGVAHILEHSVLAGSEKYPVQDAFNELSKGSLKTFINAFTAPDFTCYPVASQVRDDFYNLAGVYTDLVIRPLLSKRTFWQEGHHLEVGEDGSLSVAGIVYNEMKGAYASAESVSDRTSMQRLFPDTPYGVESGGHPAHIPDLTYEAFREFHHQYYSASNARIFFYGDIPTGDHLAFLSEALGGLGRVEVDSRVTDQPRWTAPRAMTEHYPVGPDDLLAKRTMVNICWLTAGAADLEERLILEVLQEALIGNAGSPLRKAMIDSGLGEDLTPSTGLHSWYRQLPFAVGLRGTDPDQAEAIEKLALDTLRQIVRDGLAPELVEGAFHQVEFKGLEISRTFPLLLLFRSLGCWLHDLDPLAPLRFPTLIAGLRERWSRDPGLLTRAIQTWLIDNPHRLRATIAPSPTLAAERDRQLTSRLTARRQAMSDSEVEEVRQAAAELLEAQRTEESPEALATLPVLRLEQIPREIDRIPTREIAGAACLTLEHDFFTNGIAYLDLAFDVSDVPEDLQLYLPLLGEAATGMGADGLDYETFATRKALYTGGINAELKSRDHATNGQTVQLLVLRGSALRRNVPRMVGLMRQILVGGDLLDRARLRDILSEHRNDCRAAVAPDGSHFAWRAAAAGLSTASYRDEQWHGAAQIRFASGLIQGFDDDVPQIQAKLSVLRAWVFRRARVVANLTGDGGGLNALRPAVAELVAALPGGGEVGAASAPLGGPAYPGVVIPGDVCYVARVIPVPKHNHPSAPFLQILATHLGGGFVYHKVRVEGGAYGGHAVYNPGMGLLILVSYRDPNLEKTLQVFDQTIEAFLDEELPSDDVRKAVIGTMSSLDRPLEPPTRGYIALERRLAGVTDDDRMRFRAAVLTADRAALRHAAREVVQPAHGRAMQAAYAPRTRLEAANAVLPVPFVIETLE